MGGLRSARGGLRTLRDHFLTIGVVILAVILGFVLLVGCGTGTSTATRQGTVHSGAGGTVTASADAAPTRIDGLRTIRADQLPAQARETLALIAKGGPYPYPRNDDVVYHNRNHVLPKQRDGYYHEFTVVTPGLHNRGPRRIVRGAQGELYWTADHYNTFQRIVT